MIHVKSTFETIDSPACILVDMVSKVFLICYRVGTNNLEGTLFSGVINDTRKFKDVIFCGCSAKVSDSNQLTNVTATCGVSTAGSLTNCVSKGKNKIKYFFFLLYF